MPFAPNNQAERVQNGVRLFGSLWSYIAKFIHELWWVMRTKYIC